MSTPMKRSVPRRGLVVLSAVLAALLVVLAGIIILKVQPAFIAICTTPALGLSVLLFIALGVYEIETPKSTGPTAAAPESTGAVQPTNYPRLGRHVIGLLALLLATLLVALILQSYDLLLTAAVTVPIVFLFPASYFAYITFQRNLRIERLRRDLQLLKAKWDQNSFDQSQGFWNFVLHLIALMLVTILGLLIFFWPLHSGASNFPKYDLFVPSYLADMLQINLGILTALRLGFAGSYLYCVQLVYRRYVTYDLLPSTYFNCTLVILSGLIFNFVAYEALYAISNSTAKTEVAASGLEGGLLNILAFALGFFPYLALTWISRVSFAALQVNRPRSDLLPLSLIDGISQLHENRLRDNGIDNIQNLAGVDIPFLLMNTTFSAQQVIDWVDQAVLNLYLQPTQLSTFSAAGIRTITDFHEVWGDLCLEYQKVAYDAVETDYSKKLDTRRKTTALLLTATPEQLDLLYESTCNGPNITYIYNYWSSVRKLLPDAYEREYNRFLERVFQLQSFNMNDLKDRFLREDEIYQLELREQLADEPFEFTSKALAGRGLLLMLKDIYELPPVETAKTRSQGIDWYIRALTHKEAQAYEQSLVLKQLISWPCKLLLSAQKVEADKFKATADAIAFAKDVSDALLPDGANKCLKPAADETKSLKGLLDQIVTLEPGSPNLQKVIDQLIACGIGDKTWIIS